jgi:hypothetical protein
MALLIHAGIHRTGSTSLQRFLADNRAALKARGVAYPGEERNHQGLAWALKRGESGAREVLALVEAALVETAPVETAPVETGGAARVVLSGEDFAIHTDLGWLREVAARHDTRAVFYLRRQDHWVMSWYNQHVKWPFDRRKSRMDPQAFLATIADFHWLDYWALVGRWQAVLGPGRVAVAILEPGQVEDVTGDFLDRLGLAIGPGREGLVFSDERTNDSLPVHLLEIARSLELFDMRPGQRLRVLNALRAGLADKASPARTVYSPEERGAILARFAASNRRLAREAFGREALFLEPPPGPDAAFFRFPDLPRETLLGDWIAPVVRELLNPR